MNTGVWITNYPGMAKKTVLKLNLSRYAPLSVEMQKALEADQAVITENGISYVDNEQNIEDTVEVKKEKMRENPTLELP